MDTRRLRAVLVVAAFAAAAGCNSVSQSSMDEFDRELRELQTRIEVSRDVDRALDELDVNETFALTVEPGDVSHATEETPERAAEREDALRALLASVKELEAVEAANEATLDDSREAAHVALAEERRRLEKEVTRVEAKGKEQRDLYGARWGAGVGFLTGGSREIQQASVVGATGGAAGTVSVDKSRRSWPVALLETHIYPWQPKCKLMNFGVGPFAAIGLSEDNLIDGIGGGLMLGGRTISRDSNTSFNIGIGPYLVGEIQTLADGFVEGQAPPNGETSVRYSTEEDWKLLVMFSFSWAF